MSEDQTKDTPKAEPHHEPHLNRDITQKVVLTLIGAFLIQNVLGAQFVWGNILPYVAGYFRDLGHNVTLSEFYTVLPIIVFISTVTFPIGMK